MIKLFQLLFLGHIHQWKILKELSIVNDDGMKIATKYIMQCEVCGNVKSKEV